jgi:cytochrome b involved in lipid metabolism
MFAQQHPGGSVIYTHAGRDATDIFAGFHAPATWKVLQQFYIGDYMVSSSNFLWQIKTILQELALSMILMIFQKQIRHQPS